MSNVKKEQKIKLQEARPLLLDMPTNTNQTEDKSYKRKLPITLEEYRFREKWFITIYSF